MAVSIVAPPETGTPNTVPRAALVTGAGKRIGRGIALGMARAGRSGPIPTSLAPHDQPGQAPRPNLNDLLRGVLAR